MQSSQRSPSGLALHCPPVISLPCYRRHLRRHALADVVVLVSGGGDFDLLAQKIREVHGKRVKVCGVPQLTANSLINAVSQFIPIERDLLLDR